MTLRANSGAQAGSLCHFGDFNYSRITRAYVEARAFYHSLTLSLERKGNRKSILFCDFVAVAAEVGVDFCYVVGAAGLQFQDYAGAADWDVAAGAIVIDRTDVGA